VLSLSCVTGRALQHVPLVAALADEDTRRMLLIAHLPNISAGGEGRQTVWAHPGWLCGSLRGWPLRLHAPVSVGGARSHGARTAARRLPRNVLRLPAAGRFRDVRPAEWGRGHGVRTKGRPPVFPPVLL
jgi:hypothetical protein